MSKSWAWLLLCLSSFACAQSILFPAKQVVEAQNTQGELFGFERISHLLRRGTDGAALTIGAHQLDQQDDVSVLTLTFTPAEVLHA